MIPQKAYSYIRFSSKKQAKGRSLQRQLQETRAYCKENDLDLDESLTFQDLGVSAFRGKNLEQGQLGKFIQACEDGIIPRGSAFVLESLDRLSRQRPRKVVSLLDTLLSDYGLEVHLTQVKKVFKPVAESAGEEGMDLIFAVAMAIRAAEEQETKSIRLKDAFAKQRQELVEGKRKILHTRRNQMPWWIDYDEQKVELYSPDEKAAIVIEAFELVASGYSSQQVATEFNSRKIPTWRPKAKIWYASRVRDLIRRDEALGVLSATPKTVKAGRDYRIEGYYPALVTEDLVKRARDTMAMNNTSKPGRPPSLKKPLNMLKGLIRIEGCICSHTVNKNGKGGSYHSYYNGIMETAEGRKFSGTVAASVIERLLLVTLAELKPEHLLADASIDQSSNHQRLEARYHERIKEVENSINQLTRAIDIGGELKALVGRISEQEIALGRLKKELYELECNRPTRITQRALSVNLETIRANSEKSLKDNSVRRVLRDSIASIISRIEVTRVIKPEYRGFVVRVAANTGDVKLLEDPCKLTRQRYEIAAKIHFIAGGTRVFLRTSATDTRYGKFAGKIITAKSF